MRVLFTLSFILLLSAYSDAQSICGTVAEGQNLTLTAPAGRVFVSVTFASYGTPNGACGSFTIGACHATNSKSIVETALLGRNSATIPATNTPFGDPCNGTVKRLYVEAVYAISTPLNLLNFSASGTGQKNVLQWQTAEEVNTKEFQLERSTDGIQFAPVATIPTNNRIATNSYSYTDGLFTAETSFYRLKTVDKDGSFEYSKIVTVKNSLIGGIQILSNPTNSIVTLNRLSNGWLELINFQGVVLQKRQVQNQTLQLNLSPYASGTYFLRYSDANGTSVHKLVKQ